MAAALEVLLIEDSPEAAQLTLEALRDALVPNHISVVADGEQALSFLQREPPYSDTPRPDLNLPKVDGRAVLARIKADESLMDIPVVVLTCSDNPADVDGAYRHQVAGYITKPSDLDEYFTAVRSLKQLWFKVIDLAQESESGHRSTSRDIAAQ